MNRGIFIVNGLVSIVLAVIGVAIITALISPRAQTSQVLASAGGAFSDILGTALSPVTGGASGFGTFRPSNSFRTF